MTTKTDFQGKFSNQYARHSGVAELAGDVWNIRQNVPETIAAARTLTASDSGKIFILNASAGAAVSLPAVATSAGVRYKFITGAAFASTAFTIVAATAKIQGGVIVNSTNVPCANITTITLAHGAEAVGDWIELDCDGTNWYVKGVAKESGGVTVA